MSILRVSDAPPLWAASLFKQGRDFVKMADVPEITYNLAGMLYLSHGWLLLSVPNTLVRGIFAAMHEPGISLPPGKNGGPFTAHISVMRDSEVEAIGADKIKERGKQYNYTLGRLYAVDPEGWPEIDRVWMVRVHSPELQELRRSYGLSSLPNNGKHAFHCTVAVRRPGVLARNETSKTE